MDSAARRRRRGPSLCPAGRSGQVALGQQQPRPFRRDGVEQAVHGGARRELRGLADGVRGTGLIPAGLPDPGQRHQAGGQRGGVDELTAQRYALSDVLERHVKLVPLVGHLGQAYVRGACGRRGRRPAGAVISSVRRQVRTAASNRP